MAANSEIHNEHNDARLSHFNKYYLFTYLICLRRVAFYCATLCVSVVPVVGLCLIALSLMSVRPSVCLSVSLSVTLVYFIVSKHLKIIKLFFLGPITLVFVFIRRYTLL